jgi:hypothetical protein
MTIWANGGGVWGVRCLTDSCVFGLRGWSIDSKGEVK